MTSGVINAEISIVPVRASRAALLAVTGVIITGVCIAQAPTATLNIQLDKPAHAVSPTLYGLMTEEINYSYDGGLYAEMVRNRTFQDHGWDGVARWNIEHMGNSVATMAVDLADGPSAALDHSLAITVKQADSSNPAGVRNEGYWGMAVRPNTTYKGSLYAKSDSGAIGPLTVALVSDTTGQPVATATVQGISTEWKRYDFALTTGGVQPSAENHLLLTVGHAGKLWIDLVSLFPPTYKNRENGNRADLMEMLAAMHPKFLRLPGGNYLEGDQIDERFDWKNTIGALVDRPTHRSPWNYQSSDGLGLLEFLEWSEDLHMQTVLAVYAGYSLKGDHIRPGPELTPFVEDALDEIEFATGDTSTKWGAVRAKLGHPEPISIKYVEIGNEDWFDRSGSYEGRFAQFYKAIKAKYPQLQLIATTPVHRTKPDVVDDHYYKRADEFFDDVHHYDAIDRSGPKIFVGEWATREGSPTTNMGAALGDAAWMTGMERNSDLIVMASYAPLFVNVSPRRNAMGVGPDRIRCHVQLWLPELLCPDHVRRISGDRGADIVACRRERPLLLLCDEGSGEGRSISEAGKRIFRRAANPDRHDRRKQCFEHGDSCIFDRHQRCGDELHLHSDAYRAGQVHPREHWGAIRSYCAPLFSTSNRIAGKVAELHPQLPIDVK